MQHEKGYYQGTFVLSIVIRTELPIVKAIYIAK